jgi:hypothetical protein
MYAGHVADDLLRAECDVAVADWIEPRLGGLSSVAGTAPGGFEAYVRVCHPADRDGRMYTWTEVARETGRTVHPVMQWHALVGASDYWNMSDSTWPGGDPQRGNLEPSVLGPLCAVLGEHTATPQACWLGLWVGYGLTDGHWSTVAYPVDSGRVGGDIWNPPAFSGDRPTLELPVREYFLFRGPIAAALEMRSRWDQSPNLFWPEDRAWFMASEIDFDSTVIGGSSELLQALLGAPELDAWPVDPGDLLTATADKINLVSPAE